MYFLTIPLILYYHTIASTFAILLRLCLFFRNEKKYLSCDTIDHSEAIDFAAFENLTPEFLSYLKTYGLPNHSIKLKVGMTIMLLRTLDQYEQLCNGTRLIVTRLANYVIEAKIILEKNIRNITYIPRIYMSPS